MIKSIIKWVLAIAVAVVLILAGLWHWLEQDRKKQMNEHFEQIENTYKEALLSVDSSLSDEKLSELYAEAQEIEGFPVFKDLFTTLVLGVDKEDRAIKVILRERPYEDFMGYHIETEIMWIDYDENWEIEEIRYIEEESKAIEGNIYGEEETTVDFSGEQETTEQAD